MELTLELLKKHLHYDPETGLFTRLIRTNYTPVGGRAGCANQKKTDRRVFVGGVRYSEHRLAWFYMHGEWPNKFIDHINGDPLDNRFSNLRLATVAENNANKRRSKGNRSGYKGVSWSARNRRWQAAIKRDGRSIHLGQFDKPEMAHAAYCRAARELFGEFARFN